MFDVAPTEFLLVAVIALLVIGPKDLPKVMRVVGNWVGKARRVANQFRHGLDEMVRQSELQEMEKKWAEENERIMRMHPQNSVRDYDTAPPAEDSVAEAPADIPVAPTVADTPKP